MLQFILQHLSLWWCINQTTFFFNLVTLDISQAIDYSIKAKNYNFKNYMLSCTNPDPNSSYLFSLIAAYICCSYLHFQQNQDKSIATIGSWGGGGGSTQLLLYPLPFKSLQQQHPNPSTNKNLQLMAMNTPTSTNVISRSCLHLNVQLSALHAMLRNVYIINYFITSPNTQHMSDMTIFKKKSYLVHPPIQMLKILYCFDNSIGFYEILLRLCWDSARILVGL